MKKILSAFLLFVLLPLFSYSQDYWEQLYFPDTADITCLAVNNAGELFIGTGSNNTIGGLYRSKDSGETWDLVFNAGDFGIYNLAISQDGEIYISKGGFHSFQVSEDNGNSWNEIVLPINESPSMILPIGPDTIYVGISKNYVATLLRSPDNGITWDSLFTTSLDGGISDIVVTSNGIIYMSFSSPFPNTGGVYKSADYGVTWDFIGLFNNQLTSLALNSSNDLFAGSFGGWNDTVNGGLNVLRNGSNNWQPLSGWIVNDFIINSEDDIICGTGYGVIYSDDNGETFVFINSGLPTNPSIGDMTIDNNGYMYLTSYYPTNFLAKTVETTVGLKDNKNENRKNAIIVFPNPATSSLFIKPSHSFSNTQNLEINIYSSLGKLVHSYVSKFSVKSFQLDVSDLAPGIYLIELSGKDFRETGRFVKN